MVLEVDIPSFQRGSLLSPELSNDIKMLLLLMLRRRLCRMHNLQSIISSGKLVHKLQLLLLLMLLLMLLDLLFEWLLGLLLLLVRHQWACQRASVGKERRETGRERCLRIQKI